MLQPSPGEAVAPAIVVKKRAAPPPYVSALGPGLRVLLWAVFGSFAVLGASGVYLLAVTVLNRAYPDHLFTNPFTFWTLLGHTGIGVIGTLPFLVFGFWHMATSYRRPNRVAVRLGMAVFELGIVIIATGFALVQLDGLPQLPTGTVSRNVAYFLHILVPVATVAVYVAHRRAGPKIRWKYGKAWAVGVVGAVAAMAGAHFLDPRTVGREGPKEGDRYFMPSLARTATGKFIPARALMMDDYCKTCHPGVYDDHLHSAHKFSSFNNPAYLASVNETRKVALARDGNVNASRWCAGCHDQVPFVSGKFDDPTFDMAKDPTGHAGVTCVVCHSITHVNGPEGNANFTIEEAQHYPFAFSDDPTLQWINAQLIKGKPELHKKTFLKPLHTSAEFCSTCHKVSLPVELNHYKDFLRGQNHPDSFTLSGMGNGARSFYFPPTGKKDNCASCHMPLQPDDSFGSKDFDGSGVRKRHDHFFPGANTGLFELLKFEDKYKGRAVEFQKSIDKNADYLRGTAADGSDKKLRIDLFGLKPFGPDGVTPDDARLAVLRPDLPAVERGKSYLAEVVVRTLGVGHHFSQGTVDSNEIWVDFEAKSGGKVIAKSGGLKNPDGSGPVDEWAHFINVLMLDRQGNRIDRRNPQDIFTPLYDHQIPPGAGQVVHYRLDIPKGIAGPVEITAKLRYRKFDYRYMEIVHKEGNRPVPKLPIVDICTDAVTLPLIGGTTVPAQMSPIQPAWQRWNDYGIGCLIEGGAGSKRGNLRQAEAAFDKLLTLGKGAEAAVAQGHLNKASVFIDQGRLREAAESLNAARTADPPAPWWSLAWFTGLVMAQDGATPAGMDAAAAEFEKIVDMKNRPLHPDGRVKFDFTRDFVVLAELGRTYFRRGQLEPDGSPAQQAVLLKAIDAYERALAVDPEDIDSHYGLSQCYAALASTMTTPPAAGPVTADGLLALAPAAVTGDAAAVGALTHAIAAFGKQPADPQAPRLPAVKALFGQLRPAFHAATDPAVRANLAAALSQLHQVAHLMYKPDELARAYATREYRGKHPAANAAAEAVVIYPTDRIGK